jgi:hypothetical protein
MTNNNSLNKSVLPLMAALLAISVNADATGNKGKDKDYSRGNNNGSEHHNNNGGDVDIDIDNDVNNHNGNKNYNKSKNSNRNNSHNDNSNDNNNRNKNKNHNDNDNDNNNRNYNKNHNDNSNDNSNRNKNKNHNDIDVDVDNGNSNDVDVNNVVNTGDVNVDTSGTVGNVSGGSVDADDSFNSNSDANSASNSEANSASNSSSSSDQAQDQTQGQSQTNGNNDISVSDKSNTVLDARDQSVSNTRIDARRGDATNVARAQVNVVRECVPSRALGTSLGDVFGNYGGISFSSVPGEGVKINGGYTVKELHELSRDDRAAIMGEMSSRGQEVVTCLMDRWDRINAKFSHELEVELIKNQGDAKVEAIRQAGQVAVIGQKHECNQAVEFEKKIDENGRVVSTDVVDDTLAYNVPGTDDEHGECAKNTTKALDFILSQ